MLNEDQKSATADGLRLPAKGGLTQFVGAAGPQARAARKRRVQRVLTSLTVWQCYVAVGLPCKTYRPLLLLRPRSDREFDVSAKQRAAPIGAAP